MVSAELAVGLVTLLLVLSLVLGAVRVAADRAAAVSVAGVIAREAARDGDPATVWGQVIGGLPEGADYAINRTGRTVTATVTVPVRGGALRVVLPSATSVSAVALGEKS